jgi:hypothetical protein
MDDVTQTYETLASALRSALGSRGFEVTEEHHHTHAKGSRYILLTNSDQAVCLSWDGENAHFQLECCQRTEDAGLGVWEMICREHFDPLIHGSERTQAIVDVISTTLATKLTAD